MTAMPGRVAPGTRAAFIAGAVKSVPPSKIEEGNISYLFLNDLLDPDVFYSVQAWRSQAAFDAHMTAPHHVLRVREVVGLNYKQSAGYHFGLDSWSDIPVSKLKKEKSRSSVTSPASGSVSAVPTGDDTGEVMIVCGLIKRSDFKRALAWTRLHTPAIQQMPETISYLFAADGVTRNTYCMINATRRVAGREAAVGLRDLVPPEFKPMQGLRLDLTSWKRVEPMNLKDAVNKP